jgi:hypothetical protein
MPTYGFSASDAKRIGAAVRIIERDRTGRHASSGANVGANAGVRCMLGQIGTAAWNKNATATITIYAGTPGSETTAGTLVARNYWADLSTSTSTSRWAVVSNNGFGWLLIAAEIDAEAQTNTCSLTIGNFSLTQLPNYSASQIQLLGHEAGNTSNTCSGSLTWYNITTCSTAAE